MSANCSDVEESVCVGLGRVRDVEVEKEDRNYQIKACEFHSLEKMESLEDISYAMWY